MNVFKLFISKGVILSFVIFISTQAFGQINTPAPTVPFGTNSSYAYGSMPTNLPSGGTYDFAQDAADAYNYWKSNYTACCSGGSLCYVSTSGGAASGGIVSEGIAYGMLLSAYAGDKALFDGLYAYYDSHKNCRGVMHWKIDGCPGSVTGSNGAADAEIDAAMALIVAEYQWPTATNPFDYGAEAEQLIDDLMDWEIDHITSPNYQLSNGDGWMGYSCGDTPGSRSHSGRNPGYQGPGYYQCYMDFYSGADAAWSNAITAGRNLWYNNEQDGGGNGLISNWSNPNGTTGGASGGSGTPVQAFGYEACRGPWRMAIDALWHGNAQTIGILERQRDFFQSQGGANSVGDGYNYNGSGGTGNVNSSFVAPVGAGALGTGTQSWINDMYTRAVQVDHTFGTGNNNYYNVTLRTIGLFVMAGQFWNPCDVSAGPSTITVSVTSPTNGAGFSECDGPITITADASTTNGSISNVEFFVDGNKIGEDNSAPYSYDWDDLTAGTHTIHVVAHNTALESKSSSSINVNVNKQLSQGGSPTIDGTIDGAWSAIAYDTAQNVTQGAIGSGADLTGAFKVMWDNTYFYVLADVTDDNLNNDSPAGSKWQDDLVEIYIDIGNDKAGTYGGNDYRYAFRWNDATVYEDQHGNTAGVQYAQSTTGYGYVMEIAIPWSILGGVPSVTDEIGFDFQINDDDNGGSTREGKVAWFGTVDDTWQDPSLMGTVQVGTTPCNGSFSCKEPDLGADQSLCGTGGSITLNSNVATGNGKTYEWFRNSISVAGPSTSLDTYNATSAGTYEVIIDSSGCIESDQIIITATIPAPNLGPDVNLCSPAYTDLSTGLSAGSLDFEWQRDGGTLTDETDPDLMNVRVPGTYDVIVSDPSGTCSDQTDQIIVTSSLPTPVDNCRETTGSVNLGITNASGGPYNWYANATGGSSLHTGTTFSTPSISSTTTYYVEESGGATGSVGPVDNTIGGGWYDNQFGTYKLRFDAIAGFTLTSIKVYLQNPGDVTITVLESDNTTPVATQTFTSLGSGEQVLNLNFSIPAGNDYYIDAVGTTTPLYMNSTGNAFPYTLPGVVTIDGTEPSWAVGNDWYFFFYDWQIGGGSSCDRLPVVAQIGGCGSLPVTFIDFSAVLKDASVKLNWSTASEENNSHFVVQHSTDGQNFSDIGIVNGNGTTNTLSQYDFTHLSPSGGVNYYRLAQVDNDGTVNYSEIRSVDNGLAGVQAWPNPFNDKLTVKTSGNGDLEIRITDINGKVLEEIEARAGEAITLGENLNSGVYLVYIHGENQVKTLRVVKI